MKKTKLLIPVLSIAGLGAIIAPIATMTSCSCTPPSSDGVTYEQFKEEATKIENDFQNNALLFGKDEITLTIDGNTYAAHSVEQGCSEDKRFALVRYADENKMFSRKYIDCTLIFSQIDELYNNDEKTSATFNIYEDYVKATIELEGSMAGTYIFEVYKTGFLKLSNITTKNLNGKSSSEKVEISYKSNPHILTTIEADYVWEGESYQHFVANETQYTFKIKTAPDSFIKSFSVKKADESGELITIHSAIMYDENGNKLEDWTLENNVLSSENALDVATKYYITFVVKNCNDFVNLYFAS